MLHWTHIGSHQLSPEHSEWKVSTGKTKLAYLHIWVSITHLVTLGTIWESERNSVLILIINHDYHSITDLKHNFVLRNHVLSISLPFRVLEKNICGADNYKSWIRKPILHFQTNHVTKNQFYCNVIFLDFRFFHFLCKIIIIRNCFGGQKGQK